MLEKGIAELVITGSSSAAIAVRAVIGTRFYPLVPPESAEYPCATYEVISNPPDYTLDGGQGMNQMRLQIQYRDGGPEDASYADAKAAQAAMRTLLEGFRGQLPDGTWVAGILVQDERDHYAQDAREYLPSTDFMIFYPSA